MMRLPSYRYRAPKTVQDFINGWFAGCVSEAHDHTDPANLARVSLYEAALHVPPLIEFGSMPAGTQAIVRPGVPPEVTWEDRPLAIRGGTYLAERDQGKSKS